MVAGDQNADKGDGHQGADRDDGSRVASEQEQGKHEEAHAAGEGDLNQRCWDGYKESIPAVVVFRDVFSPVEGHLPHTLGFALGAD